MLKQRVITAVILAPIMVLSVLMLPNEWLAGLLAIVALAGAWEWSTMVAKTLPAKIIYVLVCASLMFVCWFALEEGHMRLMMLLGSVYWVFILLLLSFYQSSWLGNYLLDGFLHYSGYFVIVVGWLAMTGLHQQKPALLLFLFVLIWVADIGAYFTGKKFGRSKLAEQLSPGKTREGVLGAMVCTFIFSLLGIWLWQEQLSWGVALYFVILCVLSALISVVGDLFESLLKRNAGKKDSGFLIPGHGGVLDRIDSLLAASPGFMLGLYWMY
ncbi:MAG: phosphatidate cytidylyltransferase [Gammaproteobacteria bacterium]